MFRKVFKYDLAAMGKALVLAPAVWALAVAAALLVRLMDEEFMTALIFPEMIAGIAVFFCMAAVTVFPFAVLFLCMRRYYNHFYTDEGYLTFTLPVRRETHLWSKTVAAFLVCLAALFAEGIAGGLFGLLIPNGPQMIREVLTEVAGLATDPHYLPLVILFCLTLLVTLLGEIVTLEFSVTQGQIAAKKHKILAALGIWYLISFIKRMVSQGAGLVLLFSLLRYDDVGSEAAARGSMYLYLLLLLMLEVICFFVLYFWNLKQMKNKLALA